MTSGKSALIDLLNTQFASNNAHFTSDNITLDSPTPITGSSTGKNTSSRVRAVAGMGYSGDVPIEYDRIQLSALGTNPTLKRTGNFTKSDVISLLNTGYGTFIGDDDLVDIQIPRIHAFASQAINIAAKPDSLGWVGSTNVTLRVFAGVRYIINGTNTYQSGALAAATAMGWDKVSPCTLRVNIAAFGPTYFQLKGGSQALVLNARQDFQNGIAAYMPANCQLEGSYNCTGSAWHVYPTSSEIANFVGAAVTLSSRDFLDAHDIPIVNDVYSYDGLGDITKPGTYEPTVSVDCGSVVSAEVLITSIALAVSKTNINDVQPANMKLQLGIAMDDGVYADWVDYVPGMYVGRHFKFRVVLTPVVGYTPYVGSLIFDVMVPPQAN